MAASRSSYAEVRSRTGVITASILLFVMGICGTAGLFGLMGPVLASGEMQLRPFWEHAIWAGGFTAVILVSFSAVIFVRSLCLSHPGVVTRQSRHYPKVIFVQLYC